MWDLSSSTGIEAESPALKGGILTTGPQGKTLSWCFFFFSSDRFEDRDAESQNVLGDYYKV